MHARLGLVLLALLVLPCGAATPAFRTGALEPPGPAPEFTLRADTGKTVRLRDWRGQVVLLLSFPKIRTPVSNGSFAQSVPRGRLDRAIPENASPAGPHAARRASG